nr:unnamed protein product [Digitaria exilis]
MPPHIYDQWRRVRQSFFSRPSARGATHPCSRHGAQPPRSRARTATGHVIGNLSGLIHLDLSNNTITGDIGGKLPGDIGHDLGMNLSTLNLYYNNFNGSIPSSLSRLGNLRYLGLGSNNLTGAIPPELGKLTNYEP